MLRFFTTTVTIMLLLGAPGLAAPTTLTLDDSMAMARRKQPGLRVAAADAALAEMRLQSARAVRRPSLELSTGYLGTASQAGNPVFVANNGPHELRAQVVGRWPLDTGQWAAGVRQAEAELAASRLSVVMAERAMDLSVAQAFFGVLRARATLDALRRARESVARELDAARASRTGRSPGSTSAAKSRPC